jgi:phosphohistidine phosphatase
MTLYFVQHGEAKPETEDLQRSLTARGEEEVRGIARAAKRLNIQPLKVYHSGKRRAHQTAEIIANALKLPIEPAQGLNPLDDVGEWAERVSKEKKDLMIVGHLPFLEKLASLLLCGNQNARPVLFRYGAIVCLDRKEDRGWAVRWILTPEMV